jgi:zinc D-Ala-D-Ala carboxypeptidase
MNLSPHFTLREFCISQTAARMGRRIEPAETDMRNLSRLCRTVLEPLRINVGRPVVITSGLRPQWLNSAIGGSKVSAHMDGRAADIEVPGMLPIEVCRLVAELGLPVDQCIHEMPPDGWTHVGISPEGINPRGQFLTARAVNGRTIYENGINA